MKARSNSQMVEQADLVGRRYGASQNPMAAKQLQAVFSAGQHEGHSWPGVYTGLVPALQNPCDEESESEETSRSASERQRKLYSSRQHERAAVGGAHELGEARAGLVGGGRDVLARPARVAMARVRRSEWRIALALRAQRAALRLGRQHRGEGGVGRRVEGGGREGEGEGDGEDAKHGGGCGGAAEQPFRAWMVRLALKSSRCRTFH